MTNMTNHNELHVGSFRFTYKSWGELEVMHVRNLGNDMVRLEVISGEDKGSTFCVSRAQMLASI